MENEKNTKLHNPKPDSLRPGSSSKPTPGTQVFSDISKTGYSRYSGRSGDGPHRPPAQVTSLNRYDELKVYEDHNYGASFENASRRSFGAMKDALMRTASSEQTGTAHTMITAYDRSRDVVNTVRAARDIPRQTRVAYHAAQGIARSVRNTGRFLTGKELIERRARNPETIRQINKALDSRKGRGDPFSASEKKELRSKFGEKASFSSRKIHNKIWTDTAKARDLKSKINALNAKGSALTSAERSQLKSLMEQKKELDAKLRNTHGARQVREKAFRRNKAADRKARTERSATKTARRAERKAKRGARYSKNDQNLVSHLNERARLFSAKEKMQRAKYARKGLGTSLSMLLTSASNNGEDSGLQTILRADRVFQNRYVRSILKVVAWPARKAAALSKKAVKGGAKLVGKGVLSLDMKYNDGKITKTIVDVKKLPGEVAGRVLNSRPVTVIHRELNGGIYNRVKDKVGSVVPDKIKTRVKKGQDTLNDIKTKRKQISDKFNALKERLKNSKLGRAMTAIGNGFGKVAGAFKAVKNFLWKIGLYAGAALIGVALIGAIITSLGGVSSSFVLFDDQEDGKINLKPYVKVLKAEEEDFLEEIDDLAANRDKKYTKVFVNYQTGTLVNNFKEIISMSAVYFAQDFTNRNALESYMKQLYKDSHYYETVESEPYACSGCVERRYLCTANYDEYSTERRKQLYANYASRGGCQAELKTRKYFCNVTPDVDATGPQWTLYYNYHEQGGCTKVTDTETGAISYTCPGHEERYYVYYCSGHIENICYGEHIDLDINVMVLGFDEIFYEDSTVFAPVVGLNPSAGNVGKGSLIGTFTVTHYCTEKYHHICNGGPPFRTASGTVPTPGRTIAVDTSVIPLGTHVIINGHEYIAEDTGGAIKGNRIDIAVATHAEALQKGKKTYKVYSVGSSGGTGTSGSVSISGSSQNPNFVGWTQENIDIVKQIYENMTSEYYTGLDNLNDYSWGDVSYEGMSFAQGGTTVKYFNQYDIRWKNLPYGSSTIGKAGCGPTSMAIVISTLTGASVDPVQMSNWAVSNNYYVDGVGTSWSFIPAAASNWGLSCTNMGSGNGPTVLNALRSGKLVVMSTGNGSYYQGDGHFLVLRGIDENGKILVADPASKDKSERSWDYADIVSGLKNWWIIG